jgi:hypothetical protein
MYPAFIAAGVLAFACTAAVAQTTQSVEDRLRQLEAEMTQLRQQQHKHPEVQTIPGHDVDEHEEHDHHEHEQDKFHLDIGVVVDARGNVSTRNANPARNRFDVALVELDLRARVASFADAVAILPVVREIEDPLFPEDDPDGEVETAIELEEAYLLLHDFGVPNLTAKLGRFHLMFGKQNLLHSHSLPTVDNNFVNQSFLGTEAIIDNGISVTYAIPKPGLALTAEIVTGEGGEDSPVVNNSAFVQSPAVNLHAAWKRDLNQNVNLELGSSALFANRDDNTDQHVALFGLDATLKHTNAAGRLSLVQAEAIYGDVDVTPDDAERAFGFYVLGQHQVHKQVHVGVRVDWTENAVDASQEVWGFSPYVTWYAVEGLRFRLEYQHRDGDVPAEDTLYLQATWTIGRHPAH